MIVYLASMNADCLPISNNNGVDMEVAVEILQGET